MNKKTLPLILLLGVSGLQAQQIRYFVTEYNHANYQLDATTTVGMGTRTEWNWPSFSFYAAIDIAETSDLLNDARLTGPSFPQGLAMDWNGVDSYNAYLGYDSLQEMSSLFQGGSHSFSGTGTSGLGNFTESINLPAYSKLTDRLVTNFNALQAFDPSQPLTITWEPFTEGEGTLPDGTPRGFIEVWIDYWDDTLGAQYAWSHRELDNLNEFDALPASQTSVTIPANTLTDSTNGYTVDLYFVRIETLEAAQAVSGADVVQLRSMDTLLDIWPQQDSGSPWSLFPQVGDGWIDTGNWLGYLHVNEANAPWVYSQNEQDYIYVPHNAVYAEGAWMWVPAPVAP